VPPPKKKYRAARPVEAVEHVVSSLSELVQILREVRVMATILAVEDNESVREELADILRFEGYEVTEAGNGREGLECIRQRVPDLVLCDLMMPESHDAGDGWLRNATPTARRAGMGRHPIRLPHRIDLPGDFLNPLLALLRCHPIAVAPEGLIRGENRCQGCAELV
jgi:hypothetical protein